MLEIGVNINNESGRNEIEILNNIAKAGFKNVMLSYKAGNIEDTIKTAKDLGLNVSYYHINNTYANDLWARGEIVDQYIKDVISQIKFCGKHKIPIAVMHATYGSPSDFPLKPSEQGIKNFEKILQVAKKCKVKIALENIDKYTIKHMYYLLDKIKDENLGFCYDIGHHHLYNPKTNLIKKYGERLFALHLHDNLMDWCPGYDYSRDIHLLPFDGKINFEKACKRLKKINYKGIIMLEIHKKASGKPQLYTKTSNLNYLKEAHNRAEQLANMVE